MKISLIKLLAVLSVSLMPLAAHANSGDIYVTDNSSIRRYEPNGTEHVFAHLLRPRGLAFDGSGNLFVATLDTAFHGDNRGQILKFGSDGTVTIFAAGAGLESPAGLAFDGEGNLYIASNSDNPAFPINPSSGHSPLVNAGVGRITKITPNGERGVLHLDPTTFHQNFGVAVDGQNNLFVADNLQGGIYKISPDRTTRIFISVFDPDFSPIGLAFDRAGVLYVSSSDPFDVQGKITKIAPEGTQTPLVLGLTGLRGLAFDPNGNLFAAGHGNDVIYEITPVGSVSIFASGLNVPQFLAVEP